jgi:hypothetical protein
VQTDRTIPNNKQDIIIRDNKKKGTEIQCMWNVKAKVIPVIIRATGTIPKSLRKYLSSIPGKHEIRELQKQPYWALHT